MRKSNSLDLLYELVRTNFKLKYNDSILGFVWVLLKPMLIFAILYIVFSQVGKNSIQQNFQVYLLLGVIMYSYFQESIVFGMNSLLDKAHIILKVNFNRSIAIYSSQALSIINLLINLLILIVLAVVNKVDTSLTSIAYFGLILFIMTLLTSGIAFFSSVIFVRFRDLLHITEITLQLLFYSSAIFFPISQVPEKMNFLFIHNIPVREIFELNPLFILIQASRNAVILDDITYERKIMVIGAFSFALFILGNSFFRSRVKRIAEYF